MLVGETYDDDIGPELLQDVIRDDVYGIRNLRAPHVQYVLDVGANVGFFSVMARMLFPHATVIAIEPDAETYDKLLLNTAELDIETDRSALGNGDPMFVQVMSVTDHTSHRTTERAEEGSGQRIETYRLAQLVERFGIRPESCVFKFDCEGGERFLMDAESSAILSRAMHIGIELHQDATGISFPAFREWLRSFASPDHQVDDAELRASSDPWKMARVSARASLGA